MDVEKPLAVTVILYTPGGMSWKANAPPLVLTVLRTIPVAVFAAFTLAPATTAPDGSVTLPLIAPRNVCAYPVTEKKSTRTNDTAKIAKLSRRRILPASLVN